MINNFPLFRLPFIPLYKVLDHVGPATILPLSLCSKRAKLIMKNYNGPSKRVNISLDVAQYALKIDDRPLISVMNVPKNSENLERVTIGPRRVPLEIENGVLKIYWNNERVGMEAMIEYTFDVFNAKLHSLIAHGAISAAAVKFWIEWIRKFQKKIYRLSVWLSTDYPDQLTKCILVSDFVTGDLKLCASNSIDSWGLRPSYWVTLDHFLAMDIKKIFLRHTYLTCQDVNVFLKKWINGECFKRTKEVFLDILWGIEFDVLFNDIEVTRKDSNFMRCYFGYKGIEIIVGGFDIIRKEDGAMATIIDEYGGLKILFWPDNKGNPYQ